MTFPPFGGFNPLGINGARAINLRLPNFGGMAAWAASKGVGQPADGGSNSVKANANANTFNERLKKQRAYAQLTQGTDSSIDSKGTEAEAVVTAAAPPGLWEHDFVRALRMASYGFLIYGPGQHAWYQFLDRRLPAKTTKNLVLKVVANQVMLGPCVLLVVFAWNFLWMGKIKELPGKYKRDLGPSLIDGWKFWIPASVINFTAVPLPARVGFMSTCSIFWNFYLSSAIGR
eukprot:jgi/Mesen1/5768/ME000292S04835